MLMHVLKDGLQSTPQWITRFIVPQAISDLDRYLGIPGSQKATVMKHNFYAQWVL